MSGPTGRPSFRSLSRRQILLAGGVAVGGAGVGGLVWAAGQSEGTRAFRPAIRVSLDGGDRDQSQAIQEAIDRAPDGSRIDLPAGQHRVDQRITVRGRTDLTIGGPTPTEPFEGFTTMTGLDVGDLTPSGRHKTSERAHWRVSESSGVQLRNISVTGPNSDRNEHHALYEPTLAFEAAFSIREGSHRTLLEDCRFQNVYGDGIYVGGVGAPNTQTSIRDVSGSYCGRQGFAIVNADRVNADNVICDFSGLAGLDIEPNHETQYVKRATLTGLQMGSRHFPYTLGGVADEIRREDITLNGCSVIRCPSEHMAIRAPSRGRGLRILGHTDSRQPTERGMDIGGWTDVEISGCVVTTTIQRRRSVAVLLRNCAGTLTISDNDFRGRTRGFDELVQATGFTSSATVEHFGNVWDMGLKRD